MKPSNSPRVAIILTVGVLATGALAGCTPSDSVKDVSLTLLQKPTLAVSTDGKSITIPVGESAYVSLDVTGDNGGYLGSFDVEPSDPTVVGLSPATADVPPDNAESCVDTEAGVVTRYLVYASRVGQTTLRVRPTKRCSDDGDGGDIPIPITVVDQPKP